MFPPVTKISTTQKKMLYIRSLLPRCFFSTILYYSFLLTKIYTVRKIHVFNLDPLNWRQPQKLSISLYKCQWIYRICLVWKFLPIRERILPKASVRITLPRMALRKLLNFYLFFSRASGKVVREEKWNVNNQTAAERALLIYRT